MAIVQSVRDLDLNTGNGSFSQPVGAAPAPPAPPAPPVPSAPGTNAQSSGQGGFKAPPEAAQVGPLQVNDSMGSAAAPTPPAGGAASAPAAYYPSMSGTAQSQGGIVSAAQNLPAAQASTQNLNPAAIRPVTRTVTDEELVQTQVGKIIGENSPLIQRAKALAMAEASARNLRNSTMAIQAGQAATYDAALPIATADAATYNRQGLTNQDAENQFLSHDKALEGQRLLAGEERTFQGSEREKDRSLQAQLSREQVAASQAEAGARLQLGMAELQQRGSEFQAQIAQQLRLAGLEDSRIRELTTLEIDSRNAANLTSLQQSTLANYTNSIMSIYQSNMEPDARANALRNISAIYRGNPYLPININLDAFPPAGTPISQGGTGGPPPSQGEGG